MYARVSATASPQVAAKIGQMSAIMLIAGLALGMIIGAVIGYLYAAGGG